MNDARRIKYTWIVNKQEEEIRYANFHHDVLSIKSLITRGSKNVVSALVMFGLHRTIVFTLPALPHSTPSASSKIRYQNGSHERNSNGYTPCLHLTIPCDAA